MVLGNTLPSVSYGVFSSGFSQEEMCVVSHNFLLLALMLGNKRITTLLRHESSFYSIQMILNSNKNKKKSGFSLILASHMLELE